MMKLCSYCGGEIYPDTDSDVHDDADWCLPILMAREAQLVEGLDAALDCAVTAETERDKTAEMLEEAVFSLMEWKQRAEAAEDRARRWQSSAHKLGEDLTSDVSDVRPGYYYALSPEKWLAWARSVLPSKNVRGPFIRVKE